MGMQEEMKDKAVFFATSTMLQSDDSTEDFSATINVEEWKALRLLTLAWRCFACGEIVDQLICTNRRRGQTSTEAWPKRGARIRIAVAGLAR